MGECSETRGSPSKGTHLLRNTYDKGDATCRRNILIKEEIQNLRYRTKIVKHDIALLKKEKISLEMMLNKIKCVTFGGAPHTNIFDDVIVSSSASWST